MPEQIIRGESFIAVPHHSMIAWRENACQDSPTAHTNHQVPIQQALSLTTPACCQQLVRKSREKSCMLEDQNHIQFIIAPQVACELWWQLFIRTRYHRSTYNKTKHMIQTKTNIDQAPGGPRRHKKPVHSLSTQHISTRTPFRSLHQYPESKLALSRCQPQAWYTCPRIVLLEPRRNPVGACHKYVVPWNWVDWRRLVCDGTWTEHILRILTICWCDKMPVSLPPEYSGPRLILIYKWDCIWSATWGEVQCAFPKENACRVENVNKRAESVNETAFGLTPPGACISHWVIREDLGYILPISRSTKICTNGFSCRGRIDIQKF